MTDDTIKKPARKKGAGYQGMLLGGFATFAATLLVAGNFYTTHTIQQRVAEDLQSSLNQVIPSSLHDQNLLDHRIIIHSKNHEIIAYQAVKNGKVTAVAYNISGEGYGGEISLIMGVNSVGEIIGVRTLSLSETPGLGDRIESDKTHWIFAFNGLSFKKLPKDKWKVKKDGGVFDQFSGATITPRAVVKAIKKGLEMFNQNQSQLLAIKKS